MTLLANWLAATVPDLACATSVDVTATQVGDWRTKPTGGLTAPAAPSVTRPLRLRATVFMEKSAPV